MVSIKVYTERRYYKNKWGDKEYLEESGTNSMENVLTMAAMLTGKGLHTEEVCIYEAFGETKEEAEKSIANYIKVNFEYPTISRKETIEK